MDNATNATNATNAANTGTRVRGKLATDRGVRFQSGANEKGPFEFVATYVEINGQLHDVTFRPTKWDEIAQSAAPSTQVWVTGVLTDNKTPYTVNAGTDRAYVRKRLTEVELDDIVDTKGSAIAFKRGARLPSAAKLEAEAENIAVATDDIEVENLA